MSEPAKLKQQLFEAFGPSEAEGGLPTMAKSLGKRQEPDQRLGAQPRSGWFLPVVAGVGLAFVVAAAAGEYASLFIAVVCCAICVCSGVWMGIRSASLRRADNVEAQIVEARQTQNAALMAEIHEAMGDLVVTRDLERRILHANVAFCEMTGCATPQGRSCEEIGIAFRPGGKAHCYDVEIATPYGQRIFTWHDVVTNDPTSSRLVISSLARDVTDERAALVAREDARLRAESANAAKGRLLATVSHEIRLPLSGILGMNHLLSQTKLSREQRNYLDSMKQSGQALVQLVEDLLDFSTMEAGRFKLNPRAENLRQLIESVVEMLAHRAHEKGIEIASIVTPDVPDYLDFDPARLRQVLFNLIGNAVKFTERGGVLVKASMVGQALSFAVSDTGPGMTKADQSRVFGEFEQAGAASQRSAGTGLGLAISARIVREFGGQLTVESRKGKGSTFTLTFTPAGVTAPLGGAARAGVLTSSTVLLLAPSGTAAFATVAAIEALGGRCIHVSTPDDLQRLEAGHPADIDALTDVIIDHRVASAFDARLKSWASADRKLRRILLVNPEERASQPQEAFDAWLIRPLREKSLVDVLCGRLRGMERRDAINDNRHPGFGFLPLLEKRSGDLEVLVAEDDPVNARIVRAVLEKSGCSVRLVDNFGALALALSSDTASLPDLVISDLQMPGGDGLEILPRLFATLKARKTVPFMVLSGDTTPDTKSVLQAGGIVCVLAKPLEPKRLIEEVLRLFPQKGNSRLEI